MDNNSPKIKPLSYYKRKFEAKILSWFLEVTKSSLAVTKAPHPKANIVAFYNLVRDHLGDSC